MSDIEIEIDGKPLKANSNSTLIEVADEAGIYIPRFCYHKHLSIAANCRMCLVEVEKSPKPLPACATPVMPGMKVFTKSKIALAAQKAVMEFLLINHPLDCPICDQGGECELQDLSMGYGSPDSYYNQGKRSIKDKNLGPLISSDMTRCIQCTRCVRFGDEVAGLRELGATGRGEHMEIGTYVQHAMHSEMSGNIIDVCPVGALTSKPYRFTSRAWELKQFPSIAAFDAVGSNIYVHTRDSKVMRIVPKENNEINETWISDRDRYSYQAFCSQDRITTPKVKIDGQWQDVDWQTALQHASKGLQETVYAHGLDSIGALASPSSTTEEFYLLQRLLRSLGSNSIDHRLRQVDFSDDDNAPLFPGIKQSIADLENNDLIFLIGSNIQKEQPSAALRVRKAFKKGSDVIAINMIDYDFHFDTILKKIIAPHKFLQPLYAIAKILAPEKIDFEIDITKEDKAIAKKLTLDKKITILLGAAAQNHPEAATIRYLVNIISKATNATFGTLTEGSNSAGAWIAGAIPYRAPQGTKVEKPGFDAHSMLAKPKKAYILLNVEPDLDCANPYLASKALSSSEWVISFSMYNNDVINKHARVIFPITPFTETAGTFVNAAGNWQSFKAVVDPYKDSKPAWKVLRVLANFLHLNNFDYKTVEDVLTELKSIENNFSKNDLPFNLSQFENKNTLSRIGDIPIYATNSIIRRSSSLQEAQTIIEDNISAVHLHPETAKKLGLLDGEKAVVKQDGVQISLPVLYDIKIAYDAVFIAGGTPLVSKLSQLYGFIEVNK
ncbi:NADH-quinone oxidoreductase subunit NuoG [Gammaproteobacteria bacterium]|nr:NADH-quinone oxidoreductase subunit NuoG [Gammaproteobacteria bacterium]